MKKIKFLLKVLLLGIFFAPCFVFGVIPVAERQALIDLYDSTNGDGWDNNSGWKTPPLHTDGFAMPGTEGSWHGISVSNDSVIGIDLYNNNLVGIIPSGFGNMTDLQFLCLSTNQLNGNIPPEFGNLTKLKSLLLHSNQLSGSIPPGLGNLTNLETIYLGLNQLSGSIPPSLGNLINLESLWLGSNQLSGSIPPSLGKLEKLNFFFLENNQFSGSIPSSLGNLSNLEELRLQTNQFTGSIPAELGYLTKLRYFNLKNNKLSGVIPSNLKNLTLVSNTKNDFDIRYNCGFTVTDPELRTYLNSKNPRWETQQNQCNLPTISLTSPNKGETLTGLSYKFITWSTTGSLSDVKIEYSIDNGSNWITIISSTSNTGSFNWNVPNITSPNCKIRISEAATLIPSDTSDGTFTILPGKTILITSPNESERWKVGAIYPITWRFANLTGNVRIDFTTDNGTTSWTAITYSTPITSPYNWLVPDTVSTQCKIRVTSLNIQGVYDLSDNTFSIYKEIASPQRAALIALYNATNGDNWIRNSGWKTPPLHSDGFALPGTENTWYGVTIRNNQVYQINLPKNNLTGTLPDSTSNISGLTSLFLQENSIGGVIPDSWGTSTGLQTLYLNKNNFTGAIPFSLGNLTALLNLDLSNNQLTGVIPDTLQSLGLLRNLNLSKNFLSDDIPTWMGYLTELRSINLSNNQFTGNIPATFENLFNLKYLYLQNNKLSGTIPYSLGKATNLIALNLSNNQLAGRIPTILGNLANLTYLYLNKNQLVGTIPSTFGNLIKLIVLNIRSNKLGGEIPSSLTRLVNLSTGTDLGYNALYANDATLENFLNLKDSDWHNTQTITPQGITINNITANSIMLNWSPILYKSGNGGYEIYYSRTSGGPYTLYGTTAKKNVKSKVVTDLTPATLYYFVIKTKSESDWNNANTVLSGYSSEVSVITGL